MKRKTARVFVCSTFDDMAAEREILVRQVFPSLRRALDEQNIHLVDVDLNWGLGADPTDTRAMLHIVDDELNRASHIIALLGKRYGAIVPGELDSWTALSIYAALASRTAKLLVFHGSFDLAEAELEQQKLLRRLVWLKVPLNVYRDIEEFGGMVTRRLHQAIDREIFQRDKGLIFISYSRKNIEQANQMQQMLEAAGFTVWLDTKGIALGDEWIEEITSAIDESDAVLMLVSNESVQSEYAVREVKYAIEERKPVLAYHLDDVRLPKGLRFLLGPVQHIEAAAFKNFEEAFGAIVSGLKRRGL